MQIEQKEVEAPGAVGLPQCLDLHYEEDFLKKQRHQIPLIFLDPLFIPNMAKAVFKVVKPPVVLKALPSASSHDVLSAPNQPEDGGPKLEVSKLKESTPSTSQPCQQVQEQISKASNTDSDKTDEPTPEEEQPPRSLKVQLPLKLLKHSSKATSSSSKDGATPSKVWKELEADEAEATASTGPSQAALQQARFELYEKDLPEVQEVHAQILHLNEGEKFTQEVLDSSPTFYLRWVVDETCPPMVIGVHWIDHLYSKGHIAKCKPHDFKSPLTWSPTCLTRDQRPHLQVGLEDSQVPWTSVVSRASYGTHHSATSERSYHLLVKSARKVGVQRDLHLLRQPPGWHSRILGSPWPVLIDEENHIG